MNKCPEKTDETKETLRDAFWKLYVEKPISHITVKDVTAVAGYNRGTFYHYYRDVYDVLEQIETEILDQFDMRFSQISRCAKRMDMLAIIKYTLAPCTVYNRYLSVLLGARGDPNFQAALKEKTKAVLRDQVARRYGEIDDAGEFCLEFCVSGLLSCTWMWYDKKKEMDIHEYISMMYRILAEPLGMISEDLKNDGQAFFQKQKQKTEEPK